MSAVVAVSWAAVVVTWAWRWVRPMPVVGSARPRAVEGGRPDAARAGEAEARVTGALGPGVPGWFAAKVERADLGGPVERWWLGAVGLAAATAFVGVALGGVVLGVVGAAAVIGGLWAVLHGMRSRRDDHLARSVPDALDVVARSSRAGSSVVQALCDLETSDAGPAERVFAGAGRRVGKGWSLRRSLDVVVQEHPLPAVRLAAAAILVGSETGAAPARAVEGVAATLRDRAALEREAAAHATQARASAAVLVLAPVGFALFAVAADPKVGDFLFRSPLGWVCLALGAGFDALGAWWMARIVRAAR